MNTVFLADPARDQPARSDFSKDSFILRAYHFGNFGGRKGDAGEV